MGVKMDRNGLVDRVAEMTGLKKKDIQRTIDTAFDVIVETVATGEDVHIIRIGRFERIYRAKRRGTDHVRGIPIDIPEHYRMGFRPSPSVREIMKCEKP